MSMSNLTFQSTNSPKVFKMVTELPSRFLGKCIWCAGWIERKGTVYSVRVDSLRTGPHCCSLPQLQVEPRGHCTFVERMRECGQNTQGTVAIGWMSNIKRGTGEAAVHMGRKKRTEKGLQSCQQWAVQTGVE